MVKVNKWMCAIFFVAISFQISCAQNKTYDTPFEFAQRMQMALSSSTRDLLDNEIIISKDEHKVLAELKVRLEFIQSDVDENFISKTAEERHEREWRDGTDGFRNQSINEGWRYPEDILLSWKDSKCLEYSIDTSEKFHLDFFKRPTIADVMNNIELGYFKGKYELPYAGDGFKGFDVSVLVARINTGNWKAIRFIGIHEYK
jgi:hypothetical protein